LWFREHAVTDAELIERIAQGDRSALKALYERHQGKLFNFIRGRLDDPFEAADVMQDTFIEVWRSETRYRGRSAVATWIYGIARNKAVDRIRRAARVSLRETPDDTIPDDASAPEEVIIAAGDAAQVRACLSRLNDAQRSAVRLAYFEDLAYPAIAEIEGVSLGTIKTRIHHAKKLLMHCLTRAREAF
jgi:RNA polymerase sigma-70 factor (ECF subfamily)